MNTTPDTAIHVADLWYGYHRRAPVLQGLSLRVPAGSIYGFLGANGAGKSTTIRSIMGLIKPWQGSRSVLGQRLPEARRDVMTRVGALIESPPVYEHLTGYENLKIAATYLNLAKSSIDRSLATVGLTEHAHKRGNAYSTGMKQRLGLAMALLSDPALLILDEPTNGLDPSGIIEIRNCLKNLNEQGKTVFVSSHLLSEIERIATVVGIIHRGRTLFEGSIDELQQLKTQDTRLLVAVDSVEKAMRALHPEYEVTVVDGRLEVKVGPDGTPEVVATLVRGEVRVFEVVREKSDLEQLFLHLTSETEPATG